MKLLGPEAKTVEGARLTAADFVSKKKSRIERETGRREEGKEEKKKGEGKLSQGCEGNYYYMVKL